MRFIQATPTAPRAAPPPIDMTKPAQTYIAEAEADQRGGVWRGIWAAPGLFPAYVEERNGIAIGYPSHSDAKNGATLALYHALKARSQNRIWSAGKNVRHEHMTPEAFANGLARAEISPHEFAELWGSRGDYIIDWLEGRKTIPFPLWYVLEILADPAMLAKIRAIAAEHMEPR